MKVSKVDLSGIGNALSFKDAERVAGYLFLILLAASVVAAIAVAAFTAHSSYEVFPLLALPFTVIGLLSYLYHRHWIPFIVVAVICVVLYVVHPIAGILAVYILVCTRGIAVMTSMLQKRLFPKVVDATISSGIGGKRSVSDRLAQFVFGIPSNIDTRVLRLDRTVRRNGLPWSDLLGVLRIALVPSLLMWSGLFTLLVFHFSIGVAYTSVFTIVVYIAMFSLPWIILRALDVRVGTEGRGMSLFEGLIGTCTRMSVALFVMLIVAAAALYTGIDTFWYILSSAVVAIAVVAVSFAIYLLEYERATVDHIVSDGSVRGCLVDEESGARAHLDDGIPGTPGRSRESRSPDQKN